MRSEIIRVSAILKYSIATSINEPFTFLFRIACMFEPNDENVMILAPYIKTILYRNQAIRDDMPRS